MDNIQQKPEQPIDGVVMKRQYVRVDVSARARIDNKEYPVQNISVGGISILNKDTVYHAGKVFEFFLIVPFQSFALDIPLKIEVEHYNKVTGMLGGRFIDLTKEKTSILRDVVRGFVDGDLVTAGEILNIVSNKSPKTPRTPIKFKKLNIDARQILPFIFMGLVIIVGAYFSINSNDKTSPETKLMQGIVKMETHQIQSPQGGIFQNNLENDINEIKVGQKIGRIVPSLLNSEDQKITIEIESPCDCYVIERVAMNEQYVEAGSTLLRVARIDTSPWISVALAEGEKINIGSKVKVKNPESDLKITGKADLKSISSNAQNLKVIKIIPDQTLPFDWIGKPVTVEFEGRISPL